MIQYRCKIIIYPFIPSNMNFQTIVMPKVNLAKTLSEKSWSVGTILILSRPLFLLCLFQRGTKRRIYYKYQNRYSPKQKASFDQHYIFGIRKIVTFSDLKKSPSFFTSTKMLRCLFTGECFEIHFLSFKSGHSCKLLDVLRAENGPVRLKKSKPARR